MIEEKKEIEEIKETAIKMVKEKKLEEVFEYLDQIVSDEMYKFNSYIILLRGHFGYGVTPSERRKGYATQILALTLQEARKIGIPKVLVTCNKTNIGSAKTILKNEGKFWKEKNTGKRISQYYWIDLK